MDGVLNRRHILYLTSRISIDAKLNSRISSIKKTLEIYPGMNLIKEGAGLTYLLDQRDVKDHFYTLELDKDRISIVIFSTQTPVFFMQEALLRLICVAQIVSERYEFGISSIYPYLIMILARQQINGVGNVACEKERDDSGTVLAKRVIELVKENARLKEDNLQIKNNLRQVMMRSLVHMSAGNASVEETAKELGTDKEHIIEALGELGGIGYKAIYSSQDRFSLIRI